MPDGTGGGGEGSGGASNGMGGGYGGGSGNDSGDSDVGQSVAVASPLSSVKPGEDPLSAATVNAYKAMTPQQMSDMAHVLNLPANENYTYNFNDPGIREAITRLGYISPSDPSYAWGMRAPGVTSDQMFGDETPEERNVRMKKVGDLIGNVVQGAIGLSPVGALFNGAQTAAGILSGKQTPGDALSGVAFGLVGKALGIPSSMAQSALAGDLGGIAQGIAMSALTKGVAQQTGLSAPAVSLLGNVTGVSNDISSNVKNSVNNAMGDTSTGFTKSSIANAINGSLPNFSSNSPAVSALGPTGMPDMSAPIYGGLTSLASSDALPTSSAGGNGSMLSSPDATLSPTLSSAETPSGSPTNLNSTIPSGRSLHLGKLGNNMTEHQLKQLYADINATPAMSYTYDTTGPESVDVAKMEAQPFIQPQQQMYFSKTGGLVQHFDEGGVPDPMQGFTGLGDLAKSLQTAADAGKLGKIYPPTLAVNGKIGAQYAPKVIPQLAAVLRARGMTLAEGGQPNDHEHPEYDGTPVFRTGGLEGLGGRYVEGKGDGTSDDITAMLANGEYVFSADVVSALGNGSNKAGAEKLNEMVQAIRSRARSAPPDKLPPDAKSPLEYLKSSKGKKNG